MFPRIVLATFFAVVLLLAASCGGDGEEADRVPITRLDFSGVQLTTADFFDPPFVDRYPEVVAEVNGEPITGEALAARQVLLELNRRNITLDFGLDFAELASLQLEEIESTDPLEALIDEELLRQAGERLDYLPSREEAAQVAREAEAAFLQVQSATADADRREELLRLLGWPSSGWDTDDRIVESYRRGMALGRLKSAECKPEVPTPGRADYLAMPVGTADCSELFRRERSRAEIRYFVEWAD